jgi:hypothetical protein
MKCLCIFIVIGCVGFFLIRQWRMTLSLGFGLVLLNVAQSFRQGIKYGPFDSE